MSKKLKIALVTLLLCLLSVVGYYGYVTYGHKTPLRSSANKKNKPELSVLDTYLQNNFSFTLNLGEEKEKLALIACDQSAATTSNNGTIQFSINCKNESPRHKILIGWVSADKKYAETLPKIGIQQVDYYNSLNTKAKIPEGKLFCDESSDYQSVKSSIAATQCRMELPTGKKLYSATVFIQPSNVKYRKFFVTVMNVNEPTSPEEVKKELLELLKNEKSKAIKKVSTQNSTFISRAYATGSTADSCSAGGTTGTSCPASGVDSATCGCGGGGPSGGPNGPADPPDGKICLLSTPTECDYIYCTSPTAFFNTNTGKCEEGTANAGDVGVSISAGTPVSDIDVTFYSDSLETPYGGPNPTLRWKTSGNVSSCTASGGWSGSKSPTAIVTAETIPAVPNYTRATIPVEYALTCTNGKSSKKAKFHRNYRPYVAPSPPADPSGNN